ncbi:Enoyl-CoA hydratase/carnithine racemase [Paracoccus laeviglucosivorans]|uniref:Enoyl-CoA hydratase/carnithine racemase n=2 Tax=Paracoccus laeviglucosivorans TaxID=1197861 RepID=A0A521ERH4_9RHOB|nr:enoyl-CoA hydratase/isomerase family protein [Paracoccus laeviglucosivorans]SMO86529.1 Enoyl-CoA hydratase/carnithine racemase [Paracoccus laeviglucosivorans]
MSGSCDYVRLDHDGGAIATVVIDRPAKRNALDRSGWAALGEIFSFLSGQSSLRSVILTGVPGAFCAGDDISAFAAVGNDPQLRQEYWDTIMSCYEAVGTLPVPVIAAIDGPCIGGGCTLALRADFRIAGRNAYFAVPPARLGLVYPAQSSALLAQAAGDQLARYMLYSGGRVPAEQAASAGLAIHAEVAIDRARDLAAEFVHSAPMSVHGAKIALNATRTGTLPEVASQIKQLSLEAERSRDRQEGLQAFAEKRLPRFTGG